MTTHDNAAQDPRDQHGELEDLRRQISALAEANVRAAELMVELDEARALSAALERRAEELSFQHDVDLALARAASPRQLGEGLLDALLAAQGLNLGPSGALFAGATAPLTRVAARGELPTGLHAAVHDRLDRGFDDDTFRGQWILLPLPASDGGVRGVVCLCTRAVPVWRERWMGVLHSACRGAGGALQRIALEEERERILQDLAKARDAAVAANQAKSSFLANMSHELRTPLNAILGYSAMLREDAEDDEDAQLAADLGKISRAGKQLLELINAVLDLSKVEAGKMDLCFTEVDVAMLIDDVVTTVTPLVAKRDNTLRVDVADGVGCATLDPAKVRQCLLNLLSNAAKFTERGTIEMIARGDDDHLTLTVADSGIGMSENQVARIFDPFTQAETTTHKTYGGTGLGLAITERFCRLLGGSITVESTLEVGTTFVLRLPRRGHPAKA